MSIRIVATLTRLERRSHEVRENPRGYDNVDYDNDNDNDDASCIRHLSNRGPA